ncbi:hypothetical protein Poli38472_003995 [Pythium oligandrum]|uniref:Serine aminopeptidase S33 domain-containing protein n=1 Tax=Pythium oligandrum TaxID=41045 RepID=A0A8K1CP87_PYTOL|nr:hypothetical protein Poli38472_003995 [Pythium oligandrum]|eukprot:TMW66230.1 hypothetical protein Poli38472_003995 [Pythium oligandrum]
MGATLSALVFQPPPPSYGFTRRYFLLATSKHHRIPAFYIEQERAEYTILFSHGNAEDLGMIFDWFREVARRLHVNVMAYDYSGYGISDGEPSEEAVYADVEAAFAYLVNVKKTPPSKIILYGRSLGSGPTTHIAVRQSHMKQPVAGVILQSPLLSIYRVAFNFRFTIPGDWFCNIDIIDQVESPVTIIHGTRDEVVPFWHGEGLFEQCRQEWRCKPLWVTDAGHNNVEAFLCANGDEFFAHLIEFVSICHETVVIRSEELKARQCEEIKCWFVETRYEIMERPNAFI